LLGFDSRFFCVATARFGLLDLAVFFALALLLVFCVATARFGFLGSAVFLALILLSVFVIDPRISGRLGASDPGSSGDGEVDALGGGTIVTGCLATRSSLDGIGATLGVEVAVSGIAPDSGIGARPGAVTATGVDATGVVCKCSSDSTFILGGKAVIVDALNYAEARRPEPQNPGCFSLRIIAVFADIDYYPLTGDGPDMDGNGDRWEVWLNLRGWCLLGKYQITEQPPDTGHCEGR